MDGRASATVNKAAEICYLCGKPILAVRERSVDHVPPKMVFPPKLRQERNFSNFWTAPAHRTCNQEFSSDEQYFLYSLGLLCKGSTTGHYVTERILESAQRDDRIALHVKVHREFYRDPLTGQLQKTFDHDRLYRIAHKIVRGLWYIRAGTHEILSPEWRVDFNLYDRLTPPHPFVQQLMAVNEQWGEYPDVFFFKTFTFPEGPAHAFTLMFWEWILILVTVHDPACACPNCAAAQDTPARPRRRTAAD